MIQEVTLQEPLSELTSNLVVDIYEECMFVVQEGADARRPDITKYSPTFHDDLTAR